MLRAWAIVAEFLVAIVAVSLVALALLPSGRIIAWLGLVATVWAVARRLGWDPALAAALLAAWWFAFAYSRPGFRGIVSDQGALRLAGLLLFASLAAAAAGDRMRRQCITGSEPVSDRREPPAVSSVRR